MAEEQKLNNKCAMVEQKNAKAVRKGIVTSRGGQRAPLARMHSKLHQTPTTPCLNLASPSWCTSHCVVVEAVPSAKISALPIEPHTLVAALCLRLDSSSSLPDQTATPRHCRQEMSPAAAMTKQEIKLRVKYAVSIIPRPSCQSGR
jgi:hypothetical protein